MSLSEINVINTIATQERTILGIVNSFTGTQNPDGEPNVPAVLHISSDFSCKPSAHHNRWRNIATIKSFLLVAPRKLTGGKLKYLEQATVPFGEKWRRKFQDISVIESILGNIPNSVVFQLSDGKYRPDIEHAGITWFGWEFTFVVECEEMDDNLLIETGEGNYLLLETGDVLILEQEHG